MGAITCNHSMCETAVIVIDDGKETHVGLAEFDPKFANYPVKKEIAFKQFIFFYFHHVFTQIGAIEFN